VLALPDSCMVDAYYIIYTEVSDLQLRLYQVAVDGGGASVTFTFRVGASTDYVIVVPATLDPTYEGRVRITVGGALQTLLRVVFAEGVAEIAANPTYQGNTYTFTDKYLEPAVVSLQGANRVQSVNGQNGPIFFADGTNTRVTILESSNVMRIVCIVGEGLGISCEEPSTGKQDCSGSIYYINGRHPDWLGNFGIQAGPGMTIIPDKANNKLTLKSGFDKDRPGCKDPPKNG
jgi:hypothetical protein